MSKQTRAAIYTRVSTEDQNTKNQHRILTETAGHKDWQIVAEFEDKGISGTKGRDKRPGLDAMMKAAARREFDVVMCWSIDRLGRSVLHVTQTMADLKAAGVAQFYYQQSIDSSTPYGEAMLQMAVVFAELEQKVIAKRIAAGLARVKAEGTKSGRPIGRPRGPARIKKGKRKGQIKPVKDQDKIMEMRATGMSVREIAKRRNISTNTVQRAIKRAAETE